MGMPFKTYTAEIYQTGDLIENYSVSWSVILPEDFTDRFTYETDGNKFRIRCEHEDVLLGTYIRLIASNEEHGCSAELPIKVVSNL